MSELLSQDEFDSLLEAISTGDVGRKVKPIPGIPDEISKILGSHKLYKLYDLKYQDIISKEQINKLQHQNQDFANFLTEKFLDKKLQTHLVSIDQLTLEQFLKSIPNPTAMIKTKIDNGLMILGMDLELYNSFFQKKKYTGPEKLKNLKLMGKNLMSLIQSDYLEFIDFTDEIKLDKSLCDPRFMLESKNRDKMGLLMTFEVDNNYYFNIFVLTDYFLQEEYEDNLNWAECGDVLMDVGVGIGNTFLPLEKFCHIKVHDIIKFSKKKQLFDLTINNKKVAEVVYRIKDSNSSTAKIFNFSSKESIMPKQEKLEDPLVTIRSQFVSKRVKLIDIDSLELEDKIEFLGENQILNLYINEFKIASGVLIIIDGYFGCRITKKF